MQIFETLLTLFSTLVVYNHDGPTYTTIMKEGDYELRRYDPWIVAETIVEGSHQDVGNEAFHRLGGYIFGKNEGEVKIKMTAPVTEFEVSPGKYAVQFFMPAEWTLDTLPKPLDDRVVLKELPERNLFVLRYTGGWEERKYERELLSLESEANTLSVPLKEGSQPIWARYNSPMAPSALRTN